MFIKSTLKRPLSEVLELVEFAASVSKADLSTVQVNIKNSHRGSGGGMAYYGMPKGRYSANSNDNEATRLVTLRVGGDEFFPRSNMCYKWVQRKYKNKRWHEKKETHPYGGKSSPLIVCDDWREWLVALAAHEFNHIHQYQQDLPRSEVECEKAALAALTAYREKHDPKATT